MRNRMHSPIIKKIGDIRLKRNYIWGYANKRKCVMRLVYMQGDVLIDELLKRGCLLLHINQTPPE
jgi:hypothetical protein